MLFEGLYVKEMYSSSNIVGEKESSMYGLSQFSIDVNGLVRTGYSLDGMDMYDRKTTLSNAYDTSAYQTRDNLPTNATTPLDFGSGGNFFNGFDYNVYHGSTELRPRQDNNSNFLYLPPSTPSSLPPKFEDFNFGNTGMDASMSSYLHPSNSSIGLGSKYNSNFSLDMFPPSSYVQNVIPHFANYYIPPRNIEQCFPTLDVHHPFRFTTLVPNKNGQEDEKLKILGRSGGQLFPHPPLIDSSISFMNKGYVKSPKADFFHPNNPMMSSTDVTMSCRNLEATYNIDSIGSSKIDPSLYLMPSYNYSSHNLQSPVFGANAIDSKEYKEVPNQNIADNLGVWRLTNWKVPDPRPPDSLENVELRQTWFRHTNQEYNKVLSSFQENPVGEGNNIIYGSPLVASAFASEVKKLKDKQIPPKLGHSQGLNKNNTFSNLIGKELENLSVKLCPKEYAEKLLNNVCGICDNWLRCGHEKCKQDYDKKHSVKKLTTIHNHLQSQKLSMSSKALEQNNPNNTNSRGENHQGYGQRRKRLRNTSLEVNSAVQACSTSTVPCSSHSEVRGLTNDLVNKKCKAFTQTGLLDELSHTSLDIERINLDQRKADSLSWKNASQPSTLLCSETNIHGDEIVCQTTIAKIVTHKEKGSQKGSRSDQSQHQHSWESSFLDEYGTNQAEQKSSIKSEECFNVSATEYSKPKSNDTIEGASDYDEKMFEREERAMTHYIQLFKADNTIKKYFETNANLLCHVCQNINR